MTSILISIFCGTAVIGALMGTFLKERKRLLGVDIVLWSITLLLASIFGAGRMSSRTNDIASHKVHVQNIEKERANLNFKRSVDLLEFELNHAWFIYNLPGPIKSLALLTDGTPEFFFLQVRASQYQMAALRAGHESDPYVTARLLILLHENGEDWRKLITDFEEKNGHIDEFIRAVETIYSAEQNKKSTEVANNTDKGEICTSLTSASMSAADAIEAIEKSPDSWYRTAVLSTAFRDDRNKLAGIEEQRQNRCNIAVTALSFYHLLVVAASIAGTVILWRFLRNRKQQADKPISFSFRQVYACILAFFCTMVFMAFNHAVISEQCRRVFLSGIRDIGLYNGSVPALLVTFAVTIVALISAWLIALKPDRISWRRILLGSPELSLRQVAAHGVAGFCVGTMLIHLLIVIHNLIERSCSLPSDFLQIFIIGSPLLSTSLILAYCLAGPLTEEIIFRVLLYGWMRRRLNLVVSVVAVNIIFALYHCNLPLFITYFIQGVIYTVVYERTRSLAACSLSHCLWNLLVALGAYLKLCL